MPDPELEPKLLPQTSYKGTFALVIAAIAFIVLAAVIRTFFLIVIASALAAVVILHFWNKRPVKTPEDDQVRLNLNDDSRDKKRQ
jgi:hypothetical protein